jgi:Zn/Cd-binding protein ZinT
MTDTTPAAEHSEVQKKRAAYSAAETRLREKYAAEFKEMVNEEAAARGVTYTFRKTEEERAAAQLADLLAKHPNLAAQVPAPPTA